MKGPADPARVSPAGARGGTRRHSEPCDAGGTLAYTLGEAAKAATVSKTTIRRAIENGRLSASRQDDGSYVIDPAELHRVFPAPSDASGTMARSVTANDTGALQVEVEMLRERLVEKDGVIADLREDRDHWRAQAEQATRLLTDQRPAAQPDAPRRRRWWPFSR